MKGRKTPYEFYKEREAIGRPNHTSIVEVSNFEVDAKNNIMDHNGTQMKMKMQNIREKFAQMQKNTTLKTNLPPNKEILNDSGLI